MMNKKTNIVLAIMLMVIGACARMIPHMPNFSPTESIAIFGAVYLGRNVLPYIVPILTMYFTDLLINNTIARPFFPNHDGIVLWSNYMLFNIIAIIFIVYTAQKILKQVNVRNVILSALLASIIFFLITNLGALWSPTPLYTKDLPGLLTSYAAGLPFFKTTLLSNLLFTGVIFGSMYLLTTLVKSKMQSAKSMVSSKY